VGDRWSKGIIVSPLLQLGLLADQNPVNETAPTQHAEGGLFGAATTVRRFLRYDAGN